MAGYWSTALARHDDAPNHIRTCHYSTDTVLLLSLGNAVHAVEVVAREQANDLRAAGRRLTVWGSSSYLIPPHLISKACDRLRTQLQAPAHLAKRAGRSADDQLLARRPRDMLFSNMALALLLAACGTPERSKPVAGQGRVMALSTAATTTCCVSAFLSFCWLLLAKAIPAFWLLPAAAGTS